MIIGKNYEQIKNKALQVVEKPGSNNALIQEHQRRLDKIVEEVRGSINSTDRFWNEVIGLESIEFSKFFQQHADQPLSSHFKTLVESAMGSPVPNAPSTLRGALQEFRTFIIEHNIQITPRSDRHLSVWKNTHIKDDEDLLAKAFIANELQRSIQYWKQKSYEVVPRSFDPRKKADRSMSLAIKICSSSMRETTFNPAKPKDSRCSILGVSPYLCLFFFRRSKTICSGIFLCKPKRSLSINSQEQELSL